MRGRPLSFAAAWAFAAKALTFLPRLCYTGCVKILAKTDSGNPLYPVKRKRVWEIDFLRGFCILLMIFDHAMFDFAMLPSFAWNYWKVDNAFFSFMVRFADYYWTAEWRIAIRMAVVSLFFLLSGISGIFSKNNGIRTIKLAAAAIVLSCATLLIDSLSPEMGLGILFGVLHCLALSVFLYTVIRWWSGRYAVYFFMAFGLVLVLLGFTFDIHNLPVIAGTPSAKDFLLLVLGKVGYGGDYFGLIPYTGIFLFGAAAGEIWYSRRTSLLPDLDGNWNKPLCFIGRNTIWVYLAHQPLVLALLVLFGMLAGYRFF